MTQTIQSNSSRLSQELTQEIRQQPLFQYQMDDFKGKKIAVLIIFGKLPYQVEVLPQTDKEHPLVLRTHQGSLYQQYQIINFIVNDSFMRNYRHTEMSELSDERPSLWVDVFTWSKMNQQLFLLRNNLFPMLQQLWEIQFGHKRVKKSYYQAYGNKIRKKILELDQTMNQHNQIFVDYSFLHIIIVCQLYFACKLFFQQKFRKSKARFFSKCQKVYNSGEFQEIYGKYNACTKECIPAVFQDQEQIDSKKQQILQLQLTKSLQPWISPSGNQMRNQLLYNFFRQTFKSQDSKLSYFPYYWLMYDNLLCSLVELRFQQHSDNYSQLERKIEVGAQQITKLLKQNIDYGFIGLYLNQKQKKYMMQGLICLADQSFQSFSQEFGRNNGLKSFKIAKVDIQGQQQRRKVQILWEYQSEGIVFEGLKVVLMRQV